MTKQNIAFIRVSKEIERMSKNPPEGIGMWATNDKLDTLEATIDGQSGTPYDGGEFKLSISIPSNYPNVPPIVKFKTPIYHPNIDKSGRICLESLKPQPEGKWSPTCTLETVLIQIQFLMSEPNPIDPLDTEIASQYSEKREQFNQIAHEWTLKFAKHTKINESKELTIDVDESD